MNSRIYDGAVAHARLHPRRHRFRNRVTFYEIDLSELEALKTLRRFGYNRKAQVSLLDTDYLAPQPVAIAGKLVPWIDKLELPRAVHRIRLVTALRARGYVFNPVSFYLLEDSDGELMGLIAEVNNTFGDRHVYPLPLQRPDPGPLRAGEHAKEFHVSPFNDMQGAYQFTVRREGAQLYIGVDLYREGQKIIETWIEGEGTPLSDAALRREALRHPLRAWLTMPRIIWQAFLLKFKHRLPVFRRPDPDHPATLLHRHQPASPHRS